jgi:hypothetical protein
MRVLVAAVLTMSVAQLLDLATFDVMVRHVGAEAEANPLVAALYAAHGLPIVATAKVVLLALVTSIVAVLATPRARARHWAVIGIVVGLGIAMGLVGGATNTAAIGLL